MKKTVPYNIQGVFGFFWTGQCEYRSLLSVIFFFYCLMIFETQNDQILFDWLPRHKQTNVTILVNGQLTDAI